MVLIHKMMLSIANNMALNENQATLFKAIFLKVGLTFLTFFSVAPVALASTLSGPDCANAPAAMGPDNINHGDNSNAVDGSGVWSNVVGCSASGGGHLGVQVMGAFSSATGAGAVAIGYAANAAQYGVAYGMQAVAGYGATALGKWTRATANGSVAIGGAVSSGGENIEGSGAEATGIDSIAIGGWSRAFGRASMSYGYGAHAADYAIAQGAYAVADGMDSISIGHSAIAGAIYDVAIGGRARTAAGSQGGSVAIGYAVQTGEIGQNVAMGAGATFANAGSAFGGAVAIGRDQKAIGDGAVALGDPNSAIGTGAVALGANNIASGDSNGNSPADGAVAIGNGNRAIGQGAVALGNNSSAAATGALALGDAANAKESNAIALGSNSSVSHPGSVALGANSMADGATLGNAAYNFGDGTIAGANPVGEVSVGGRGSERRLTNVAAGSGDTDAVNVSQLKTLEAGVTNLGVSSVKYDRNSDGTIDYTRVTMNPAGLSTKITNIAKGDLSADSTDAVNGAQLYQTNQDVMRLDAAVNSIASGGGTRYFHANSGTIPLPESQANGYGSTAMGPAAVANGTNSVAAGSNATAHKDGDVALGADSVADRGAEKYIGKYSGTQNDAVGTVSIGSAGMERSVSNVADGRGATDAVNVRQLDGAIKESKDYTDQRFNEVMGTTAQAGDDFRMLDSRVASVEDNMTKIVNGSVGMFQTDRSQTTMPSASGKNSAAGGMGAVASGANSTSIGNHATAIGDNATAIGNSSKALGVNSTAIGGGSDASGSNSVALGYGSDANRDNVISVGAPSRERQIANVAAGIQATDAVNVSQLNASVSRAASRLQQEINETARKAYSGVAAATALAMIPDVDKDRAISVGIGLGVYQGYKAIALGATARIAENVKMRLGISSSASGNVFGAGASMQW
ncbi:YadA family autotransporter adhesin [Burkholderia ubonensis]|uniref:YadA family autotransporter adhesin n=1 Tax=Burkholderia ubonensis TaxID=101571 RepID=UPI000AED2FAE|nr:YadA-like family protein [Burkholderia ubonensis]